MLADRLRNHALTKAAASVADVVRALGAVQAQDYPGARWAVGQRLRRATDESVRAAYDRGDIIRTHIMRPTWHFVAPEDLRWMQALCGPRVRAALGSNFRQHELDATVLSRSRAILGRALRDNHYMTRQELRGALERGRIDTSTTNRLAFLMMDAELEAIVCSGPVRGKQFTYALVDERVPASPARTTEEALAELTRRYFTSHGPATVRDFVWWSGLTVTRARQGIDLLGRELKRALMHDREYWSAAGGRAATMPVNRAWLLPNFDEYFIAYKDRDAVMSASAQRSGVLGNPLLANGAHPHLLMIDGLLAGTWGHIRTTKAMRVEIKPFRKLSPVSSETVDRAIADYLRFVGQ